MNREQAMKLAEAVNAAIMRSISEYGPICFRPVDLAVIVDAHVAQAGQQELVAWRDELELIRSVLYDYDASLARNDALRAVHALLDVCPPVVAVHEGLRELLTELEWAGSYFDAHGYAQTYCLVCQREQGSGHAVDCKLEYMLYAAPKPEGGDE